MTVFTCGPGGSWADTPNKFSNSSFRDRHRGRKVAPEVCDDAEVGRTRAGATDFCAPSRPHACLPAGSAAATAHSEWLSGAPEVAVPGSQVRWRVGARPDEQPSTLGAVVGCDWFLVLTFFCGFVVTEQLRSQRGRMWRCARFVACVVRAWRGRVLFRVSARPSVVGLSSTAMHVPRPARTSLSREYRGRRGDCPSPWCSGSSRVRLRRR